MRWSKICVFTFLFCFSLCSLSFADVSVEKIDGLVDWNKPENYAEAKRAVKLAKEINAEKRRRKQLRDAGVPEEEIVKIIRNERAGRRLASNVQRNKKADDNNKNNILKYNATTEANEEDDEEEYSIENDDNDDDEDENLNHGKKTEKNNVKINDYLPSNGSNNRYESSGKNNWQKSQSKQVNYKNEDNNGFGDYSNANATRKQEVKSFEELKSIVPQVPNSDNKTSNIEVAISSNSNYEDWELERMLSKAGNNLKDREKFMIFAREAGKIASRREKNSNFMDVDLIDADISYEFDDESNFSANSKGKNSRYARYKKNYYASNAGNKKRQQNSNNFDIIRGQKSKSKGLSNKVLVNKPLNNGGRFYASSKDEYKARPKEKDEKKYNVAIGKNTMTDKQIQAKNVGAPFPEARTNKDKKTQYRPQNIAQIAYDKNNRHLQPAVFEKDIISQAFEKLGDPDAIQISKALIDKFGKVDIADEDGNTLLMHAIARGNQSLTATLLAEGANPNAKNVEGFAPIHLAASNGDNVAMYSIMMNNGNPNLSDNSGNTALMYASKMCNADTIKLMISLGGNPDIENQSTGRTAFDFASENPDAFVITLLKRKHENMFRKRNPVNLVK